MLDHVVDFTDFWVYGPISATSYRDTTFDSMHGIRLNFTSTYSVSHYVK